MKTPLDSQIASQSPSEQEMPEAEAFAFRLFSITMVGLCAAILLMIILGDWTRAAS